MSAADDEPIRIEDVTHRYGALVALDSLTLTLPAGKLVGLIGPDGVGKSTLLGLIAGAKALQTGSVTVLGGNIGAAGQPPKCRNSLHSHTTAEVFFVLKGRWRFFWGRWGDAGEVVLEEA